MQRDYPQYPRAYRMASHVHDCNGRSSLFHRATSAPAGHPAPECGLVQATWHHVTAIFSLDVSVTQADSDRPAGAANLATSGCRTSFLTTTMEQTIKLAATSRTQTTEDRMLQGVSTLLPFPACSSVLSDRHIHTNSHACTLKHKDE